MGLGAPRWAQVALSEQEVGSQGATWRPRIQEASSVGTWRGWRLKGSRYLEIGET